MVATVYSSQGNMCVEVRNLILVDSPYLFQSHGLLNDSKWKKSLKYTDLHSQPDSAEEDSMTHKCCGVVGLVEQACES